MTIRATLLAGLAATPVAAADLTVVTDIAPVHSIVAGVMGDRGAPVLLLNQTASPHDYAFRPSDAKLLSGADAVFWVGHGLTPWLEEPLETLATNANVVELLETEGWEKLDLRALDAFNEGDHDHDHGEDEHDEHDDHGHEEHHDVHEEHEDHAEHEEHDDHEDHDDHAGHDEHGHDHGDFDPHAFLGTEAVTAWAAHVAEVLADLDPEGAEVYRANAEAWVAELALVQLEQANRMTTLADRKFIVAHDAYQYLERSLGLTASGTIALSDSALPGPSHIAEVQEQIVHEEISCVLTDPQINPKWAILVTEGSDARTVAVDPMGADLEPGAAFYGELLVSFGDAFTECLTR